MFSRKPWTFVLNSLIKEVGFTCFLKVLCYVAGGKPHLTLYAHYAGIFLKAKKVDPDQLASSEASWSGSILFLPYNELSLN